MRAEICGVPITPNDDQAAAPFKTPLFEGRATLRVSGDGAPEYMSGKTRTFWLQVSGRFRTKQDVGADNLWFGARWDKPIAPIPLAWAWESAIRTVDPSIQVDIASDAPYLVSPALCALNVVRTHKPIEGPLAPSGGDRHVPFRGMAAMDPAERRAYFGDETARQAHLLPREDDYTFEFWYSGVDLTQGTLRILSLEMDYRPYLNGQPVAFSLCSKDRSKEFWRLTIAS